MGRNPDLVNRWTFNNYGLVEIGESQWEFLKEYTTGHFVLHFETLSLRWCGNFLGLRKYLAKETINCRKVRS